MSCEKQSYHFVPNLENIGNITVFRKIRERLWQCFNGKIVPFL